MYIPPTSNAPGPLPIIPRVVQHLYDVWNSWYNEPTRKTAEKLLHFLQHHEVELTQLVGSFPAPFGKKFTETFPELYSNTVTQVTAWITHCKRGVVPETAPLSELLADIYDWALKATTT